MPEDRTGGYRRRIPKLQEPTILVFRDKLLLPSEGFIKAHYTANFDAANLVYLASQFGLARRMNWTGKPWQPHLMRCNDFCLNRPATPTRLADFAPAGTSHSVHAHFGRGGALALPVAQALGLPLDVTISWGRCRQKNPPPPPIDPNHLPAAPSYN